MEFRKNLAESKPVISSCRACAMNKAKLDPSSQIDTVLLVHNEEGRLRNRGPLDVCLQGVRLN